MEPARIDPGSLASALAGTPRPCVLDVRDPASYEAGHIPGSRNIPVHDLVRRAADLPGSKVVRMIVVGDPGRRSDAAAVFLTIAGYPDVAVLEGGVAAWTGPVETGPEPPRPPRAGPELRVI